MLTKKLKKFGYQKNWYRTQDSVFGVYNGFCYNIFQSTLMSNPGYKIVFCSTGLLNESQITNLHSFLESNKSKFGYKVFEVGGDFISVTFYENLRRIKNPKLESVLELFSEQLKVENVNKVFTKEISTNHLFGYYDLSGEGVILHAEEYKKTRSEIQRFEEIEDIERSSYLPGFIGAILFCIPVIIVWTLLAIYVNMFFAILGIVMAFASYFGYERFRGRLGWPTKWILIFVTIISILLANLSTLYFQMSGYGITLSKYFSLLVSDEQVQIAFLWNAGLGLTIGLVGLLWIVFGLKTKVRYIKEAVKLD